MKEIIKKILEEIKSIEVRIVSGTKKKSVTLIGIKKEDLNSPVKD